MHKARSGLYSLSRRTLMSSVYLDPEVWGCGTALLDFGCGDGWYLDWCRARGVEAIGFEPGAGYASSLSERIQSPVFSGLDELLELRRASFDVVTMHFVVEHLVDIRGALMSASELLKPGGIIRYVVPNIDSWEYRLFGQYWHSLDPPRHISFPDGGHARRLAEELGMEFLKEESVAFPNGFGGSIPTFLLGRFNAALFFLTLPLSLVVTRLFPSGNRAYWMRRPT